MEIYEVTKGKAKTGFYWIMPEGETKAAETLCEFGSDVNMRGACLASYGIVLPLRGCVCIVLVGLAARLGLCAVCPRRLPVQACVKRLWYGYGILCLW